MISTQHIDIFIVYNTQSLGNSIINHETNIISSALFVRDTRYTYMYIIFDFLYEILTAAALRARRAQVCPTVAHTFIDI